MSDTPKCPNLHFQDILSTFKIFGNFGNFEGPGKNRKSDPKNPKFLWGVRIEFLSSGKLEFFKYLFWFRFYPKKCDFPENRLSIRDIPNLTTYSGSPGSLEYVPMVRFIKIQKFCTPPVS